VSLSSIIYQPQMVIAAGQRGPEQFMRNCRGQRAIRATALCGWAAESAAGRSGDRSKRFKMAASPSEFVLDL
jgi:hypothetical protein